MSNHSPGCQKITLQQGINIDLGGEQAESIEANDASLKAFPVGLIIRIGYLVAQFRFIRWAVIILLTVPLAASWVFPALLLSGALFGFISLLGLLVLIGSVVNNGIVLIDRMLLNINKRQSLNQSIVNAISMRFYAALPTSLVTPGGMSSLAVNTRLLWPPSVWTLLDRLLFLTLLTLVVLPC